MAETATEQVQKTFLTEVQALVTFIMLHTDQSHAALSKLMTLKDTARMLRVHAVVSLCLALERVYQSLCDQYIAADEHVLQLIRITAQKLPSLAVFPADSADTDALLPYIVYCDKAAAGEIFDISALPGHAEKDTPAPTEKATESPAAQTAVQVSLADIQQMLNGYEELIARTYKVTNELSALGSSAAINGIISDVQFLQNGMRHVHAQLLSCAKDDEAFVSNHRDFHGFFVFANEKKYFLSATYIVDVTYENELDYGIEQNQRFLRRTQTDADGNETEEHIPVYALSSIFPHQKHRETMGVDIVLIASYHNQRIGMIVDAVQQFATLVKKNLPRSFRGCSMLEGIVFDETYAMIPILSVPAILKRFRSQRGYDVKLFETHTKRHSYKILVADDSETTRQILQTVLTGSGFSVDQATDGIIALEMLKTTQYDALVTDDDMPRMNGAILIDNLRRMAQYATLPVVALAAQPIASANAYISKADFQRATVIQTIRGLLSK